MTNILHITASPRGADSVSSALSAAVAERLSLMHPQSTIVLRDLHANPLSHVDGLYAHSLTLSPDAQAIDAIGSLAHSDEVIAELLGSDVVVIGTPMHNFTLPSSLKAWVDHIVRIFHTFEPTPTGKIGLVADRPVYVAIASGGFFYGTASGQPDFLTPYLEAVLRCIGITSITFLPLQGTVVCSDAELLAQRNELLDRVGGNIGHNARSQVMV